MAIISFVLGATDHGPMIVSRHDYCGSESMGYFGVGHQLLETGTYDQAELDLILANIPKTPGALVLDIGANIGAMTLPIARHLRGFGTVIAFEPQQRIFYALSGNIALNNCWNATAVYAAIAEKPGVAMVPILDYQKPASSGSVGLKARYQDVGQVPKEAYPVTAISVDALNLPNLTFMKIDVEGMEMDVLKGAKEAISTFRPGILVEHIKSIKSELLAWFSAINYSVEEHEINLLCRPL